MEEADANAKRSKPLCAEKQVSSSQQLSGRAEESLNRSVSLLSNSAAFHRVSLAAPTCQVSVFGPFLCGNCLRYLSLKLLFLFLCLWKTQTKRKINVSSSNRNKSQYLSYNLYLGRSDVEILTSARLQFARQTRFSTFIYLSFIISSTLAS